jgi:hypothetical protein
MPNEDLLDTDSLPKTEPYLPTFDTGAHQRAEPELIEPKRPAVRRRWWRRRLDAPAAEPADEPVASPEPVEQATLDDAVPSGAMHAPAPPIAVPGRYHYLSWWQFILMLLAVWLPAGAIGAGLFYWWTHDNSAHKTPVVFVVVLYVIVTTVAGIMLAMVADRPLVSALAIAMLSAVFASVVAAAPCYGAFYCDHIKGSCLMGVVPY